MIAPSIKQGPVDCSNAYTKLTQTVGVANLVTESQTTANSYVP
jgi:hypothetical protein